MNRILKRLKDRFFKTVLAAATITAAAGTAMSGSLLTVNAAPASTYSQVEVKAPVSDGPGKSSLTITNTHAGESFDATSGVAGGAVSAASSVILPIVPEVTYANAGFDPDKSKGSYVTIIVTATTKLNGESDEKTIVNSGIITHGSNTDTAFREYTARMASNLISGLADVAKKELGNEYANENLKVKDIQFLYYTVSGTESSSDYTRRVRYHVAGNETGTHVLNNTEELLNMDETVRYPSFATGNVFNGWYLDEAMTKPISGIINPVDFKKGSITDIYGAIIADDGAKLTYTVYAYDTSTGTVESGQATPIEGVTFAVTKQGNNEVVGNTKLSDATGKAVFELGRGNWYISETELPAVPGSETKPMVYTNAEPGWVAVRFAAGTPEVSSCTFMHDRVVPIVVHFDLNGGRTDTPIADQMTAKDGLVLDPGRPVKEVNGAPYEFLGWFKDGSDAPYDFESHVTENADFTLTAHWKAPESKTVKVEFVDMNEDSQTAPSSFNFTVTAYSSVATNALVNEEGQTVSDILQKLGTMGYTKYDHSETYPSYVAYGDGKPETITVHLDHMFEAKGGGAQMIQSQRTITYKYEDGSDAAPSVVQTAQIMETGNGTVKDLATGRTVTKPGAVIVKNGWAAVSSPAIAGYRADIITVPGVEDRDQLKDGTVVEVVYSPSQTVSDVTVTLTGHSDTVEEYDGEEHSLEGYEVTITDESGQYTEADFEYTGTASITGKNAGVYSLGLDISKLNNLNEKFNVRFVVKQGYLTINPKSITITPEDKEKMYGDPDPEFTATVEGTLNGDTVEYSLSRAPGEQPTTVHPIYVTCIRRQGNYFINTGIGYLTIKAEPLPSMTPVPEPIPTPETGYVTWHTDIDDEDQTVSFPGIKTTASDVTDQATDDDKENYFYIEDRVDYSGLTPGRIYEMTGTLMDKATGEAVEGVEPVTRQFRPSSSEGKVTLTFKISREILSQKTVVVFEDCRQNGRDIAIHHDINDEAQTVRMTEKGMHTTARDTKTKAKVIRINSASEVQKVSITDTVAYSGLTPNVNYTLAGTVHISINGEDSGVLSVNGEEVRAEKKFAPSEPDGTVDVVFEFDGKELAEGEKLVVFERLYLGTDTSKEPVLTHEKIDDEGQTVTVEKYESDISIGTTAESLEKKKTVEISPEAKIVDTVEYVGLTPDTVYTLKGELHLVGEDGSDAGVIAKAEKTFMPEVQNGYEQMLFTFDARELSGRSVVVFEYLYENTELKASHADIEDKGQTVTVVPETPEIRTTAKGKSGGKTVPASETATVVDTVRYKNLIAGKKYTMKGTLHLIGSDGTDERILAAAETDFTAESRDGSVVMTFTFDASLLKERSVVVFEDLYEGELKIASHADLKDDNQTVKIEEKKPEIRTTAKGKSGGKSEPVSGTATIVDTVKYKNLIPGRKYIMKGTLHLIGKDKTDEKVLASAETEFTAESENGNVIMTFTFDASALENRSVVVFEDLYEGELKIAAHADLNDTDQTVKITEKKPDIGTTAASENGGKTVPKQKDVIVVDTVEYSNLIPGKEYVMKGSLHLVSISGTDEKVLDTNEVKFKPDHESGSVKMTFKFDADSLGGRRTVVFEELYEDNVKVAVHTDINDRGQSVDIENPDTPSPDIHTMAYNLADGYDTAYPNKSVTINDIVYYEGLIPHIEYILEGTLQIKNPDGTDGGILYSNGNPVTASKRFTPSQSKGAVELSFTFDASAMNGTVCVAFERLYLGSDHTFVQSHEDITDDEETIWIDRNPKRRRKRIRWIRTGAGKDALIYGGLGLAAVLGLVFTVMKYRKSEKTGE